MHIPSKANFNKEIRFGPTTDDGACVARGRGSETDIFDKVSVQKAISESIR